MRRIRVAAAALLLGSSIVVGVVAPASACDGKLTKTCQSLEQVVCDVFHKCL